MSWVSHRIDSRAGLESSVDHTDQATLEEKGLLGRLIGVDI